MDRPTSKSLPAIPSSPYKRYRPTCYFSLQPLSPANSTSSSDAGTPLSSPFTAFPETPADPDFPLIAYRAPSAMSSAIDASKLLSLQTNAAYSTQRPRAKPVQDVLEISDEGSPGSKSDSQPSSASSSTTSLTSPRHPSLQIQSEIARCSRCQRTSILSSADGRTRMVSYGTNLYYCSRCAAIVGYGG